MERASLARVSKICGKIYGTISIEKIPVRSSNQNWKKNSSILEN